MSAHDEAAVRIRARVPIPAKEIVVKIGKDRVSIGDLFIRAGGSRTVYRVVSCVEGPFGTPAHVRLVSDTRWGAEQLLMSVSALTDTRFFGRLARPRAEAT
jgi:hypothetical protein